MRALLRVWAVVVVAAKRLLSQPGLALAAAVGVIAGVALAMSVPLYADAVYNRVLHERVGVEEAGDDEPLSRPPFAFTFRYMGGWSGPRQWEEAQAVDRYLTQSAGPGLGLPQRLFVRFFRTDTFRLFPHDEIAYADSTDPMAWVTFGFVTGIQDHITILEGAFPTPAEPNEGSTIEVLVSEQLAVETGLQVGESFIAFEPRSRHEGRAALQVPLRVAGVWRANDPREEFWFYRPTGLNDVLLVPEESFANRISPYTNDEVYLGIWYLVLDGSRITSDDAARLLRRIARVWQQAEALLPGTQLASSPIEPLRSYLRAANLLTILLAAFSVPIIGLVLIFIGLVVGLTVDQQRNEIAVLRSRGASALQVLGIAAVEGLLLAGVTLAAGAPVGQMIALVMGKAQSFLNFTAQGDLNVRVTQASLRFGLAVAGLALVAKVVPTAGAARQTIVAYKQERARVLRPPWWQRAWLDLLLLIPAAYGAYLLREQRSIVLPGAGGAAEGDPFQNPLLLLVPTLLIFALALLTLRLLPPVMAAFAWLASRTGSVGALMAARYLARSPRFYTAALLLLVMTLSLAAFTASLAQTLDYHLYDQLYYQIGADMHLDEMGLTTGGGSVRPGATGIIAGVAPAEEEEEMRWLFLPVSEHLRAPGVAAAARVGRYAAAASLAGNAVTGTFLGVDRVDFPRVAFWRWDFAPESLGGLMNALARAPNGVLVSRDFMRRHGLAVGENVRVEVTTYGQRNVLELQIVGGFDHFPTWYPVEGQFFVGNLDYLFEAAGGQFPYDVWLATEPDADYWQVVAGVRDLEFQVIDWKAPLVSLAGEQRRPERQGLFGLLSIGFLAAAVLTVVGFLLSALFSFRRRFVELGVLRAIGLSAWQMTALLAWELGFLIATGLAAGTGLGIWVSALFIPYLQVGSGPAARVPPFLVEIAWPAIVRIYLLFGLLFVVALVVLVALLRRMQIFQAIKLGETT